MNFQATQHFLPPALVRHMFHFRWSETPSGWICEPYVFSNDLSRPIEEITLCRAESRDPFDALEQGLRTCQINIKPSVWDAFYRFRNAALERANTIEDLL